MTNKNEIYFTEKDLKTALEKHFKLPKDSITFVSCTPIFNKDNNFLTYWK